ncbi:MAG: glucokinase [Robiginitomaculum sp.]|nr:MAG: glucokinase [Robiginitomaculum sp.]
MKKNEVILVGDIGGTNTRLALAHYDGHHVRIEGFEKFKGKDYSSLKPIIETYLAQQSTKPISASLAVAGPIHNHSVKLTNRDWQFSEDTLESKFGFEKAILHNDFSAMARSIPIMDDDSFDTIFDPKTSNSNAPIIVAGPGTGFGMGIIITDCHPPHVLPSEGGHQAYAPQTEAEFKVLQFLQNHFGFVSLEAICSGSGMNMVHKAICAQHGKPYEQFTPEIVRQRAKAGDKICLEICEIRAAALMGAVGDMALACGSLGGVVLAGGVSERLIEYIRAPKAMARFFDRGPQTDYMRQIPIRLLKNHEAPLYGVAALYADHQHS